MVVAFPIEHCRTTHTPISESFMLKVAARPALTTNFITKVSSYHIKEHLLLKSCLYMISKKGQEEDNNVEENGEKIRRKKWASLGSRMPHNSTIENTTKSISLGSDFSDEFDTRVTQLEKIVTRQEIEIQKLKKECIELEEAAVAFARPVDLRVVDLLRQASLGNSQDKNTIVNDIRALQRKKEREENEAAKFIQVDRKNLEYIDNTEIFRTAPSSVIDAADAVIFAGMLEGKRRMLVDVRDAELSRDPEVFVQFMEIAILPVAAGLQGLKSTRNRVKIVFPTVSQLLQYRKTMVLSAPEVVALSTLGFEPIEERDQLVILVTPSPDDDEGLAAMNEILVPNDPLKEPVSQPIVVVNHHMLPVAGPAKDFEMAYHLRLLSVQYMSGSDPEEYTKTYQERHEGLIKEKEQYQKEKMKVKESKNNLDMIAKDGRMDENKTLEDEALEAAMKHAHEIGMNQGVTRAMVIRAYPKPWHIFVDTSPDTDADFEVAATFNKEPTQEDVNLAIVECLEGSEREDELVAQQMQQALEEGQLDQVADILGISPKEVVESKKKKTSTAENDQGKGNKSREDDNSEDDDDDNSFYNDFV